MSEDIGTGQDVEADGYEVEEIYVLTWDNRPGAVVKARSISMGEMLERSQQATKIKESGARDDWILHVAEFLADVVVSWTLKRRGVPIPVTPEGCLMIGNKFLLAIYGDYMSAGVDVPEDSDLGKDSLSGGPYPEELDETEAL